MGVRCATWARAAAGLWQAVLANAGGGCRNTAQGMFLGAPSREQRFDVAYGLQTSTISADSQMTWQAVKCVTWYHSSLGSYRQYRSAKVSCQMLKIIDMLLHLLNV